MCSTTCGHADEDARRWFRRYWTLGVGPGAHLFVNGLFDVTREMAEEKRREVFCRDG